MRRYVLQTIAVAAGFLVALFCAVLYLPSPIAAEYGTREIFVIKREIALATASPKIVFLGGSSTLFGIDAREVEAESGLRAVNLGLHAAMHLDRLLSLSKEVERPGDILALMFEHGFYHCKTKNWTDWQIRNSLAWDRPYFDGLPFLTRIRAVVSAGPLPLAIEVLSSGLMSHVFPEDYVARIDAMAPPEVIMTQFESGRYRPTSFAYSPYNLDDHGDMPQNQGTSYLGPGVPATAPGEICPELIPILKDFVDHMRAIDVRVLVAHTPYLVESAPASGWEESERHFTQDIAATGAEMLDTREELFLPRKYFFDTQFHLNELGRHERTKLLINDLKRLGIGRPVASSLR